MKFSIRDLLLVTVIVAVALAWGLDRSRLQKKLRFLEFMMKLEEVRADAFAAMSAAKAARTKAEAEIRKAVATQAEARQPQPGTEGPLRGYNLLGPPVLDPQP